MSASPASISTALRAQPIVSFAASCNEMVANTNPACMYIIAMAAYAGANVASRVIARWKKSFAWSLSVGLAFPMCQSPR